MSQLQQPYNPKLRQGVRWWQALGFMLLGSFLTIGLLWLWLLLTAGTPVSSLPLTLPAPSGKPDLTASVSQEYINREIAVALAKTPISVLGVATIKEVVLEFQSAAAINIKARLVAFDRQFEFTIPNSVALKNNKVSLNLREDVKLGAIPLGILNDAIEQVNRTAADQLNGQLSAVGQARNCTTGQLIGRVPTLLALRMEKGVLNAEFGIKIEG